MVLLTTVAYVASIRMWHRVEASRTVAKLRAPGREVFLLTGEIAARAVAPAWYRCGTRQSGRFATREGRFHRETVTLNDIVGGVGVLLLGAVRALRSMGMA